jgi:hypothetical protein
MSEDISSKSGIEPSSAGYMDLKNESISEDRVDIQDDMPSKAHTRHGFLKQSQNAIDQTPAVDTVEVAVDGKNMWTQKQFTNWLGTQCRICPSQHLGYRVKIGNTTLENPSNSINKPSEKNSKWAANDDNPLGMSAEELGSLVWEEHLSPRIRDTVSKTLTSALGVIKSRERSFELYGFDLMLDSNLQLWLMEVNLSPALNARNQHLAGLIENMSEGLVQLTVDRFTEERGLPVADLPQHGWKKLSTLGSGETNKHQLWSPKVSIRSGVIIVSYTPGLNCPALPFFVSCIELRFLSC